MSAVEHEPDEPEAPKSDHDVLVEIRDLLKQLLDGLASESGGG